MQVERRPNCRQTRRRGYSPRGDRDHGSHGHGRQGVGVHPGRGGRARARTRARPRLLGPHRVRVQLAFSDLGDPHALRHALRGADTVIHLAATIRDQPPRRVEEVNGLGTLRLLRAAERAGVERFVFFSAMGATRFQRTRFFRSKALAEEECGNRRCTRRSSPVDHLRPRRSLGHDHAPARAATRTAGVWIGAGEVPADLGTGRGAVHRRLAGARGDARYELAGPEILSHEEMVRLIAAAAGRHRRWFTFRCRWSARA